MKLIISFLIFICLICFIIIFFLKKAVCLFKRKYVKENKLNNSISEYINVNQKIYQTEKLAVLGELVGGISHELNNKLTPLYATLQTMKNINYDETTNKNISDMLLSVNAINTIMRSLFAFSKNTYSQKKLYNITDSINLILSLTEYKYKSHNVQLITEIEDNLPFIYADKIQLEQVLLNILNNAYYAINKKEGTISIKLKKHKKLLVITIKDNGIGIKQEDLIKVFDPFFSLKPIGEGAGLGLSVAYGIIKSHNGDIKFDSIYGQGTVVTVTLPFEKETKKTEINKKENKAIQTNKKNIKILLIDDEEMIIDILKVSLSKLGFKIDTAVNGKIGLKKIKQTDYDIIISDLRMPVLNGFKLYEWIKNNKPHLIANLIFTTGDINDNETRAFLDKIENNFILKPFTISEIASKINTLLEKGKY